MSSVRIGDNPGATSFPHTAAFLGIYFDDLRWASVPIAIDGAFSVRYPTILERAESFDILRMHRWIGIANSACVPRSHDRVGVGKKTP